MGGMEEKACAGSPLQSGAPVATEDQIIEAMRTVFDPEIPVNIYDMGLIYETKIADDGSVRVNMSLTSPACPVAGILPQQVADAVAAVEGVGEVCVELVWDPPWSPDLMAEDAKLALGIE
jgi:FeS assembly SUF system protein